MDGVVGRGTLLAGRYRTLEPLALDLPGASAWEATDQILDRPVRVTVLHSGHVPQALDAARRAALVTDPRLVRVLDVGEHEGVAYTVTEQVTGPSLAELVTRGPLPADQARAIVGEAASALEAARRRGVHHGALRPSVLHLTPDDRILVTGIAIDAALVGHDAHDAAASRTDTLGLVGLLYAALTGRWPATVPGAVPAAATDRNHGTGLDAAPVLEGAPVPPAEVASGVPNDLDTLCAVTLGVHDDGPQTPAQLVQELEPWGDIRATDLFAVTQPLSVASPAPRRPASPPRGTPTAPARVQRTSVRSVFADQTSAAASRPGTPPPAVPRSSAFTGSGVGTAGAAAAAARAGAADGTAATTRIPATETGTQTARVPVPPAEPTAAAPGTADDVATTRTPVIPPPDGPPTDRTTSATAGVEVPAGPRSPQPASSKKPPRVPKPPKAGRQTAPTPPASQPSAPTAQQPGLPTPRAAAPASPTPTSAPRAAAGAGAAPAPTQGRAPSRPSGPASSGPASSGRADRPPLLTFGGGRPGGIDVAAARESIAAHRFDPTRLVLLLVGLAVVLGLVIAANALTSPLGPPSAGPEPTPTESAPPVEPEPEPEPAPEEPAPEEPPAPAAPPVIASGVQLDPPPDGDGNEHPEAVDLAIDGDPSTVWYTRTYGTPQFGGLKDGLGYAVTLAEPAAVSTVTLQVRGSGGRVEVRATDPSTPTDGAVLAEAALAPETVLTFPEPTETQHVVLWFTELPQTEDGSNRVELAEVTVS